MSRVPLSTAFRLVPALAALTSLGLLAACATEDGAGTGRKYVLFFSKDSSAIGPAGSAVLRHAAAVSAHHPEMAVLVAGFAAAHGDLDADQALSQERADVVAAALRADGIPAGHIVERARPPANENPAVAARRVEVSLVSQP